MPTESQQECTFEEALERLESIVEAMEDGQIPLAELLSRYEEGTRLLKICEGRLKDAELKIEILKKARDAAALEPFAPERAGG